MRCFVRDFQEGAYSVSTNYDDFTSAAKYRKLFYEIGKSVFGHCGFQFKNKCFYRKNGDTFQAVTLQHRCGRLGVLVVPYWCDIMSGMPFAHPLNTPFSSVLAEQSVNINPFTSIQLYIKDEYNYVSKLGEGIEHFLKTFDSETRPVIDEKTYVKYMWKMHGFYKIAEDAVIYASFKSGSVEFARNFIDAVDSICLKPDLLLNGHTMPPGKLNSDVSEKQVVDSFFLDNYFRNYRCRFPKIYKYIDTGKTDIEALHQKESQKMRMLYKKAFKIDF